MVLTPHVVIAALASLTSFGLAAAGLVFARPGWIRRGFVTGMAAFGTDALTAVVLQLGDEARAGQALGLIVREGARLVAPLAWVAFLGALTRRHTAPLPRAWRLPLGLAGALAAAIAAAVL